MDKNTLNGILMDDPKSFNQINKKFQPITLNIFLQVEREIQNFNFSSPRRDELVLEIVKKILIYNLQYDRNIEVLEDFQKSRDVLTTYTFADGDFERFISIATHLDIKIIFVSGISPDGPLYGYDQHLANQGEREAKTITGYEFSFFDNGIQYQMRFIHTRKENEVNRLIEQKEQKIEKLLSATYSNLISELCEDPDYIYLTSKPKRSEYISKKISEENLHLPQPFIRRGYEQMMEAIEERLEENKEKRMESLKPLLAMDKEFFKINTKKAQADHIIQVAVENLHFRLKKYEAMELLKEPFEEKKPKLILTAKSIKESADYTFKIPELTSTDHIQSGCLNYSEPHNILVIALEVPPYLILYDVKKNKIKKMDSSYSIPDIIEVILQVDNRIALSPAFDKYELFDFPEMTHIKTLDYDTCNGWSGTQDGHFFCFPICKDQDSDSEINFCLYDLSKNDVGEEKSFKIQGYFSEYHDLSREPEEIWCECCCKKDNLFGMFLRSFNSKFGELGLWTVFDWDREKPVFFKPTISEDMYPFPRIKKNNIFYQGSYICQFNQKGIIKERDEIGEILAEYESRFLVNCPEDDANHNFYRYHIYDLDQNAIIGGFQILPGKIMYFQHSDRYLLYIDNGLTFHIFQWKKLLEAMDL